MKKVALIVGGGSGVRFGSETAKQFVLLKDKPLLFYSLIAFHGECHRIILVLSEELQDTWKSLVAQHHLNIEHEVVSGGATRSESVRNGMALIDDDCIVAVHDAVRPLVSKKLIQSLFTAAGKYGSAVPVLKLSDSIRELGESGSKALNRDNYRLVQTPQCFVSGDIKKAYQDNPGEFSDDAGIAETAGIDLYLIGGEYTNIKITYPLDLKIAETLMAQSL